MSQLIKFPEGKKVPILWAPAKSMNQAWRLFAKQGQIIPMVQELIAVYEVFIGSESMGIFTLREYKDYVNSLPTNRQRHVMVKKREITREAYRLIMRYPA